jgi:hypothetical protein
MAMVEIVRQFLHRKPFAPFRIVMKSGERHDIDDAERIALSKSEIHWFPKTGKWVHLSADEIDVVYKARQARH